MTALLSTLIISVKSGLLFGRWRARPMVDSRLPGPTLTTCTVKLPKPAREQILIHKVLSVSPLLFTLVLYYPLGHVHQLYTYVNNTH